MSGPPTFGIVSEPGSDLSDTKDTRSFLPPRTRSLPPHARSRPYAPGSNPEGGGTGGSFRGMPNDGNGDSNIVDGHFQFSPSVERRGSSTGVVEV